MKTLLEVNNLSKHFVSGSNRIIFGRSSNTETIKAVDDISLRIHEGESFGLVGESGCGKSTAARTILLAEEPTSGEIIYTTQNGESLNLVGLRHKRLRALRPEMQMIFQDPFSSLNPRMTVRQILSEGLIVHNLFPGEDREGHLVQTMNSVGLSAESLSRFPHAFSGGQRQRIAIARALCMRSRFLICDEAVSALDVSVQAQVLNLLKRLQQKHNLTYLFISHDLSVVYHFCDTVAVMYLGQIVEMAPTLVLFENPRHPYTEALLSATPKAHVGQKKKRIILTGEVPNPSAKPSGCAFHPRCAYAQDICRTQVPNLEKIGEKQYAACHFSATLDLQGAFT